ncbi:MAG: metallophosphoesterase family protein [Bacteroidales bacterium]|nr:metallophosphoesterase family protein [Bacteroidales bacterium]MBD5348489.1 metallophosphoesterase family protein [Bacteroides sp.]
MKKIGILSDTHGFWDSKYIKYFEDCDEIWHAGDIGDISIIEKLESICPVKAVKGNADFGEVARRFESMIIFEIENIKVLLTHIGGYPGKWAPNIKQLLKENSIKLIVDGHSHILKVIYDKELDLLHVNPGAAGQQGWHKKRTLVRLDIDNSEFTKCEIIELA